MHSQYLNSYFDVCNRINILSLFNFLILNLVLFDVEYNPFLNASLVIFLNICLNDMVLFDTGMVIGTSKL